MFSARFRSSITLKLTVLTTALLLINCISSFAQSSSTTKSSTKKAPASQHGLTQADVQKMWALQDDALLSNQIKLKGLAFSPEEDWINQLQQGGVTLAKMPLSAAALKGKIEPGPEIDVVSAAAPALLDKAKVAAQARNGKDLEPLLHPDLLANKAKIYDLFDVANYRGHSLGTYSQAGNRQVSVQFFQLTSSQVERIHYVYFSTVRGKIVIRDVRSGPEVAEHFLRDEEQIAKSKLELMFRALNDGDDAGVKMLCTDGLYQGIKDWGGDKHPGDRLTRGRKLDQVTVTTSVPLDQKSIRVVARISYPLTPTQKIAFDADFERIGNDLKIVRVRDTDNKIILVDPDIDNYLNRRFGLPDGPKLDLTTIAKSEQVVFWSLKELRDKAMRALEDHDAPKIKDLAQTFIDSDPSGGEGYGFRAGAQQILGNYDEADKDVSRALQHGGTVYLAAQRHGAWSNEPFTPVLLAISRSKMEYIPGPGRGTQEEIDIDGAKVKFDTGKIILKSSRPFLSLTFKGTDGKNKTYNFAALGTACAPGPNLVPVGGGGVCGEAAAPGSTSVIRVPGIGGGGRELPLYVPRHWQQDLTTLLRAINEAQGASGSK